VATLLEQILAGASAPAPDDEFARMMTRRFLGEAPMTQVPGVPQASRMAAGGQTPSLGTSPPQQATPPPAARPESPAMPQDDGPTFMQRLGNAGLALQGRDAVDFDAQAKAARQQKLQANKTYSWLVSKGSSPEEAEAAIGNSELLNNLFKKYTATAEPKQPALREIFDEATGQPRKQEWNGSEWVNVGGVRAPEKRDAGLSATEMRAVFSAEDELPALENTLTSLERAKELNSKTYTGYTAGARGWFGTSVVPNTGIVDDEAAKATREWGQIMSMEAIKNMAATLTGATTNFELAEFQRILSDPTTPPDIRERTIDRMITLAKRQKGIKESRIKELRGPGMKRSGDAAPAAEDLPQISDPSEAATLPSGTRFIDPEGIERVVP
jgi:hypothetical protein